MASKPRKPVEARRVPLNCLVRPDTKQEIRERAVNGKSQGQVIDEAMSALYRETGTAYDPHAVAHSQVAVTDRIIVEEPRPQTIQKSVNGERVIPMPPRSRMPHTLGLPARPFKGPLLKPKERKGKE